MNRLFTFLLTGLLTMTAIPFLVAAASSSKNNGGQTDAPFASAEPVFMRLANGLTVLVKEDDRFPLVSLRLYVHAGSVYEQHPSETGISHMLEHMVFKGTGGRPKGQVAADVEKTGGYLNAATSFDYTVYLTDMTVEHWKTGLDVLKDMAFNPSLEAGELESEKDVVVAELKRGEDNPGQRLFRMTQETALKGTPYSTPIIGYEKTVRAFTAEAMRAYIERLYQPQSMLLVVCGNVKAEEVQAEAARLFGDLKNTHSLELRAGQETTTTVQGFSATVEEGPWKKVHLALAVPVPGLRDIRSAQLDVLAHVLGGDTSSRLYRTYKYNKRLVDSISVSNYSFERLGLLFIQATLDADKLFRFWEEFSKELLSLSSAVFTREELDRAKLNIEDELFRSKETLAGYTSKLGYFAFFGNSDQAEANYLRTVRDTDQRVLQDLVQTLFTSDKFSLTALLPQGMELPAQDTPSRATSKKTKKESQFHSGNWKAWFEKNFVSRGTSTYAKKQKPVLEAHASGKPEIINLGQGRTVVLTSDSTLPYTAVNLLFTGGNSLLSTKDQGLAAFTASLLTKGTKDLSATALEDFLSDRAASFSASSGRETFSVSMDSPARFTPEMFSLLRSVLVTPAMTDAEATRARENQMAAIVMQEDQPTGLAFRRMFSLFFENHPYGFLQLGEKERVAAFTSKEAKEFWREQTLQPWVLSICGEYDREAVLAAAKQLPVPGKPGKTPDAPVWSKNKDLILTLAKRNQAHLFLVFPTTSSDDDDEPGLDLLQNILSGQSGLLFRDMRDEQGLGYTVTAFPWKTEKTGALIFYIGTDPNKIEQAEAGFQTIIASLKTELLPDAELERGKNQMEGDYYRNRQTLAARSAEGALLTMQRRPLNFSRVLVEKARSVDAKQIQSLARRYLDPANAYLVKVLP